MSAISTDIAQPVAKAELDAFLATSLRKRRAVPWRLALVAEVALILLVWQIAVGELHVIDPDFFPPPLDIAASLVALLEGPSFQTDLTFSLSNYAIGTIVASLVGVVVGLSVGLSRLLSLTVRPIVWSIYSIPKVALAPLLILFLGLGPPSKLAMVFLLAVFPVLINTMDGVATVDPSLVKAGRVYGLRGWRLALRIILPGTFPFVIVGLKRAIALGFIGEVLGEFLGSANGLGVVLQRASYAFQMNDALAVVVVMVIASNLGLLILDLLQRRLAPWSIVMPGSH